MLPFGVPRTLIEDDKYRDFVFEKGTTFVYNSYAISHNEKEYQSNEVFSPERYLDEDLQDMLKGHLGFGTGVYRHGKSTISSDSDRAKSVSRMARGNAEHVCKCSPFRKGFSA
jgi:hypothetical protein